MKTEKHVRLLAMVGLVLATSFGTFGYAMDHGAMGGMGMSHDMPGIAGMQDMTDGEVRKIDHEVNKITIRHGEIRSRGMPAMTMVFPVSDPSLLDAVKVGDKIKFRVAKSSGGMVLTEIQPSR